MKEITLFENVDMSKSMEEQGINPTMYWAYRNSKEAANELLNFDDVIWDYDVEPIVKGCKEAGVREFTISSTFSSLIAILAAFESAGARLEGLTQVHARYTDWQTGEKANIPAIRMSL